MEWHQTRVWCIWYHSTYSAPAITTSPSSPMKVTPTSCVTHHRLCTLTRLSVNQSDSHAVLPWWSGRGRLLTDCCDAHLITSGVLPSRCSYRGRVGVLPSLTHQLLCWGWVWFRYEISNPRMTEQSRAGDNWRKGNRLSSHRVHFEGTAAQLRVLIHTQCHIAWHGLPREDRRCIPLSRTAQTISPGTTNPTHWLADIQYGRTSMWDTKQIQKEPPCGTFTEVYPWTDRISRI